MTEQKQILEGPELMIPAEVRTQILAQSGASAAELKSYLASLLGGAKGFFAHSSHYQYDAQGITEIRQQISSVEQVIKFSYNDHGDKAEETRTSSGEMGTASATDHTSIPSPALPSESHSRYEYLYDTFGNWTEQTVTSRAGSFKTSQTTTRILTYY